MLRRAVAQTVAGPHRHNATRVAQFVRREQAKFGALIDAHQGPHVSYRVTNELLCRWGALGDALAPALDALRGRPGARSVAESRSAMRSALRMAAAAVESVG